MISLYDIKPAFQKRLQPLLKKLRDWGVTPNQLTLAAVLLSLAMGYAFLQYKEHRIVLLIIPFAYLFRMALNALDGMMARQFQMQSKLGELLNEFGDVISDLAIILPLSIVPGLDTRIVIAFAILAVLNEFAGVMGRAIGGERYYDGPMGKSDRAFMISIFCLVFYFWPELENYANIVFLIATALVIISTTIRLKKAIK